MSPAQETKMKKLFLLIFSIILALVISELVLSVYAKMNPEFDKKLHSSFFNLIAEKKHPYCGEQLTIDYSQKVRVPSEYIILLLGGSSAYGIGSDDNENKICVLLEKYLNKKHRLKQISKFRVINAANPSYHSTQEKNVFMQFLSEDAQVDMLVSISGFNNLARSLENYAYGLPFNYPGRPWIAERLLMDEPAYYLGRLFERIKNWKIIRDSKTLFVLFNRINYFCLKSYYKYGARDQIVSTVVHLSKDKKKFAIQKGTEIYKEDVWQIHTIAKAKGIDAIFILQPLLGFQKEHLTAEEQDIIDSCRMYDLQLASHKMWVLGYKNLQEKGEWLKEEGVNFLDFTDVFKKEKTRTFTDLMHMNETGQDIFSQKLSDCIINLLATKYK